MRSINHREQTAPQRPLATGVEINAMHDKAAGHQLAADKHEAQAQHAVNAATHMADEMVSKARAEADEIVRRATEQAAAHQRQADEQAAALREVKADEEGKAKFWQALAADEALRANLPTTPALMAPGVDAVKVTARDGHLPVIS